MGLIAVSGQPGCRFEEVARITASRLGFELVTASRIAALVEKEFAPLASVPNRAYLDLVASIVARLATTHHLVMCGDGLELLSKQLPGAHLFDLILNAEQLDTEHIADLIVSAAHSSGLIERGYLSAAAEAQLQFRCRLRLSKHGIVPPDKVALPRKSFAHPSEEIFANLLDFYRIPWEYEPRSFPIQWDRDGKVAEAFTPDFYLTEFDMYVELTTMKQSLVTRKNRKVKLLRQLYPHVNIQVFYQKDFENLIFKYGLAERTAKV